MKTTTVIFKIFVLLLPALISAQGPNEKPVNVGSVKYYPPENFSKIIQKPTRLKASAFGNNYYVVIQFDRLPTGVQKKQIDSAGIRLIDYLPENAYTAAIPVGADLKKIQHLPVWSIFRLLPEHKMSAELYKGVVPQAATRKPGFVDVNLITFDKFNSAVLQSSFDCAEAVVLSEQSQFKTFALRLPQKNIRLLACLPFVQWIEPVEPENATEQR